MINTCNIDGITVQYFNKCIHCALSQSISLLLLITLHLDTLSSKSRKRSRLPISVYVLPKRARQPSSEGSAMTFNCAKHTAWHSEGSPPGPHSLLSPLKRISTQNGNPQEIQIRNPDFSLDRETFRNASGLYIKGITLPPREYWSFQEASGFRVCHLGAMM